MSSSSPTPLPGLCHPAEVSQGAEVGSRSRSSLRPPSGLSWCLVGVRLCELTHRSGRRASSAPGPGTENSELAELQGEGGRCLPDQHSPEGETGSSPQGRTVSRPVAKFGSTTQRSVETPVLE